MARIETKPRSFTVRILALVLALLLPSLSILSARPALALQENIPLPLPWAADLPVYDHIVIIVEENKDYEQIIGNKNASYINDVLRKEGAILTKCYAEEHHSEGNYFWLFSGSNQRVGFIDSVPGRDFATSNLGEELIRAGLSHTRSRPRWIGSATRSPMIWHSPVVPTRWPGSGARTFPESLRTAPGI